MERIEAMPDEQWSELGSEWVDDDAQVRDHLDALTGGEQ
jgi:hypothetical protein